MTTFCSEHADIEWLTGSEADVLLTELAENSAPLHTSIAQLRKRFSPSQTHLLAEQVELRRRAAAKFTHPEKLFFTRLGLEQATDEWVARYKASRFQQPRTGASPTIADLCCGIGGDLMALANCGKALGIDRDPVAAHFARVNSQVDVRCIDVADFDFDGIDAWHIDPDRRPTGRRTTSLEWCQPNRNEIERLLARLPHAAIKLAPATAVPDDWAERCELEWISRDRECRQQIAWHGDLATDPGRRRATILLSRTVPSFLSLRGTMGLSPSATCGAPHNHWSTKPTNHPSHKA